MPMMLQRRAVRPNPVRRNPVRRNPNTGHRVDRAPASKPIAARGYRSSRTRVHRARHLASESQGSTPVEIGPPTVVESPRVFASGNGQSGHPDQPTPSAKTRRSSLPHLSSGASRSGDGHVRSGRYHHPTNCRLPVSLSSSPSACRRIRPIRRTFRWWSSGFRTVRSLPSSDCSDRGTRRARSRPGTRLRGRASH